VTHHDLPGLAAAVDLARAARRVVLLSGAGMSAESGVPTFREAQTGLWERFSPEQLASEDAFLTDPDLVWAWYQWRARLVRSCSPHAGHRAVAAWQRRLAGLPDAGIPDAGPLGRGGTPGALTIATQNVDDLHERAGAEVLAHLHGSLFEYRCAECGAPADYDPGTAGDGRVADGRVAAGPGGVEASTEGGDVQPAAGSEAELAGLMRIPPPTCAVCGEGRLRPGIVWFGEMLPADALAHTFQALDQCDLAVVVGTSALVQPAASLPYAALGAGAAVIEVNPAVTEFSTAATVHVPGTAGAVLPALAAAVG
jgi:NAD-dependent deacetylase